MLTAVICLATQAALMDTGYDFKGEAKPSFFFNVYCHF